MKWRCTWCGKPHDENDPPCDSCGHGTFEEADVREQEFETVDTGTQYMWVCTNCGRQHMKNNPPCSRCGGHDLEKREQTYEDVETDLEVPSWLEVAKPYAPIVLLVAIVAGLFVTGIVSPSILPGIGSPSPPDAPGEGEQIAGIDLEAVEDEVHERLEDERALVDRESREYDSGLAAYATYGNREYVDAHYEETEPDGIPSPDEFGASCAGEVVYGDNLSSFDRPIDAYDDEAALADATVEELLTSDLRSIVYLNLSSEALDVHVGPDHDRRIFVFYTAC